MRRLISVVEDPLIPVIREDNSRALLSLRDVFTESRRIRCFAAIDPAAEVVLIRLCSTVLARAITADTDARGEERQQREALNRAWSDPDTSISDVQEYLGRWSHRMNLNDPNRPFLQHPDLVLEPEKENLDYLRVRILDYGYSPDSVDTSVAFQAMIRQLHYDPGAIHHIPASVVARRVEAGISAEKAKNSSIKMGPGLTAQAFVLSGKNLYQTLLSNVTTAMVGDPDDRPLWELADAEYPDEYGQNGAGVNGPNSFNFGPYRAMKLTFSEDGTRVRAFACVGGVAETKELIPELVVSHDPYSARYVTTNKKGEITKVVPRNSNPAGILDVRAALDTAVLKDGRVPEPAPVFSSLLSLDVAGTGILSELSVVVVSTVNRLGSKVVDLAREAVRFDLRVAEDSHHDVRDVVLDAFSDLNSAVSLYRTFLWELHLSRFPGRRNNTRSAPEIAFRHAFTDALRGWLAGIDADTPADAAADQWQKISTRLLDEHSRALLTSLPDEVLAVKQAVNTDTGERRLISAPAAQQKLVNFYSNRHRSTEPAEATETSALWDADDPDDGFADDNEEETP